MTQQLIGYHIQNNKQLLAFKNWYLQQDPWSRWSTNSVVQLVNYTNQLMVGLFQTQQHYHSKVISAIISSEEMCTGLEWKINVQ